MLVEWRVWEVFNMCDVEKDLRFRRFFLHHAKNAQGTIARSKRSAWSESKVTTLKEATKALEKWRRKFDIEKLKYHKLFKGEEIAKHFSLYHSLRCNVEAISIFESRLKFFCYWFFCNWFKWKLWNARRQLIKFCRDSHVFFDVRYFFHFTRYCWFCCRKIYSTSYSWSFCD